MDKKPLPYSAEEIKNFKFKYKEFIGTYKNVLSKKECKEFINFFKQRNDTISRQQAEGSPKFLKEDQSWNYSRDYKLKKSEYEIFESFLNKLQFFVDTHYVPNYPGLRGVPFNVTGLKIQETKPGGGYHIWHSEQGPMDPARTIVYTLYLNDIKKGGETEFLNQSIRVSPERGLLCLFPAAYTHLHRGNPPLKKTKYILTGWISMGVKKESHIKKQIKLLQEQLKQLEK